MRTPYRYRGWDIGRGPAHPVTGQWRAESFGVTMSASTRIQLERMVDFRIRERPPNGHGNDVTKYRTRKEQEAWDQVEHRWYVVDEGNYWPWLTTDPGKDRVLFTAGALGDAGQAEAEAFLERTIALRGD